MTKSPKVKKNSLALTWITFPNILYDNNNNNKNHYCY